MVAFRGHFDGKVIVPSGAVDLPRNRELLLHADTLGDSGSPSGVPGASLLRFSGQIDSEDLLTIERAIESDCEQVNRDEW